ncbi:hypothetical protein M1N79_05065 [Dehalococcoidia bacterium]|nr:hypothetical protein [Dehalococcoidia bacterium]
MANILIKKTKQHLLQRAKERFGLSNEEAQGLLQEVKKTLEKEAPSDWRFTVSPSAMFFVAYEPAQKDVRLVGRSYRDCADQGKRIIERLKVSCLSSGDMDSTARQYVSLLMNPGCDIYHELKTIYRRGQDMSEEKTIFQTVTSAVTHIVPITAKRVASRPNAIVKNGEIWVRQREYLNLSSEIGADYQEHLVFERLTRAGIDKSLVHYYTFDKQGNLKYHHEVKGIPVSISSRPGNRVSGRTQSYWTLPTYVDAVYIDLKYAVEHWVGDTDPQHYLRPDAALRLLRMERLMELARRLIF